MNFESHKVSEEFADLYGKELAERVWANASGDREDEDMSVLVDSVHNTIMVNVYVEQDGDWVDWLELTLSDNMDEGTVLTRFKDFIWEEC